MSENVSASRNWKVIARELANEQNPSKCWELSEELNKAIAKAEEERKGVPLSARNEIARRDQA